MHLFKEKVAKAQVAIAATRRGSTNSPLQPAGDDKEGLLESSDLATQFYLRMHPELQQAEAEKAQIAPSKIPRHMLPSDMPVEQVIADLDDGFQTKDFDPIRHMLEGIPTETQLKQDSTTLEEYLQRQYEIKDIAKDGITALLSGHVSSKYDP
jgi:hypothetical protein